MAVSNSYVATPSASRATWYCLNKGLAFKSKVTSIYSKRHSVPAQARAERGGGLLGLVIGMQPVYDLKAKYLKASCSRSQALKIAIECVGL